ncbi:hypothetical protein GCM10023335_65140 [Streptomyces siamensis]|uniref:Uncharacterized protein n=2 Tax=Streptomyces siamensis TaxID=1274986 RepID=A0ABP9JCU2_9ACTN
MDPDMGERHGHGGSSDRRVAHPGEAGRPDLGALLASAVRAETVDAEDEARAVAAFRAARDEGALAARTRRRDDWRPRERRRPIRSLKAMCAVLLASLTLGGVAVAAIGSVSDEDGDDQGRATARPSRSVPDRRAAESVPQESPTSAAPDPSGRGRASAHPTQAQDTVAHCRAYDSVKDRGQALNSTAWQRLVTAAGGEDKVAAYCAEQLADAPRTGNGAGAGNGNTKQPGATQGPASPATASPTKPAKSNGKP